MDYKPENNGYNYGYDYHQPKPKKKKAGKIIAICLACVIFAAAAGSGVGVLVASMDGLTVSQVAGQTPVLPGAADPAPVETPEIPPSGIILDTHIIDGGDTPVADGAYTGKTLSASELYNMAVNSCVGITVDVTAVNAFGQVTSSAISGSGFIISTDGYILTNYHVVQHADENDLEINVTTYAGDKYTATLVGKEAENDVALLKVDAKNLPALVLNTSGSLIVGQNVYVIGNPLGELTYTLTDGIVSALDREIAVEANASIRMFQISAAINSGNSGGPVFNDKGEVIGIASAKYASACVEGLGFAIPIEDAMEIVDDLIQYGFVRGKAYFGITVRTVTKAIAEYYNWVEGAFIVDLDEDSCAAVAGLRESDIIVKVDDYVIKSSSDLILAKKNYVAGDSATLEVFRDGEYFQTTITFEEEGYRAHFKGENQN
ncbi:MAG: trypsin-like peptidase domain-containing protein, partial [Oscillospiraceae bacterium]|nr:trypsin-like peptidase domain-containing protein [Oscillospiraceae bacterium]